MTPLRFRAWHKEAKRFVPPHPRLFITMAEQGIEYPFLALDEEECKDYVLMQSTGLTDKNGKEIFEGDIFSLGMNRWGKEQIDCVRTLQEFFETKGYDENEMGRSYENINVIGDIYTTPDLLP